jgi:hypothetical protein
MSDESLSDMLAAALDAHSVRFRREGSALVLQDAAMTLRGDVQKHTQHPSNMVMQVAFATEAPALGGRTIWNVFAGVGADENSVHSLGGIPVRQASGTIGASATFICEGRGGSLSGS